MPLAALFTWLITASGGLLLLTIWLIEYDREFQSAAATRLPVPVISAHALLAVAGLVVWAGYLITDSSRLAWAAAVTLAVVATLGITMAARWIRVYRAHETVAATGARAGITGPPERNFPLPVVGHGIFAAATFVLVLLTALGAAGVDGSPAGSWVAGAGGADAYGQQEPRVSVSGPTREAPPYGRR